MLSFTDSYSYFRQHFWLEAVTLTVFFFNDGASVDQCEISVNCSRVEITQHHLNLQVSSHCSTVGNNSFTALICSHCCHSVVLPKISIYAQNIGKNIQTLLYDETVREQWCSRAQLTYQNERKSTIRAQQWETSQVCCYAAAQSLTVSLEEVI